MSETHYLNWFAISYFSNYASSINSAIFNALVLVEQYIFVVVAYSKEFTTDTDNEYYINYILLNFNRPMAHFLLQVCMCFQTYKKLEIYDTNVFNFGLSCDLPNFVTHSVCKNINIITITSIFIRQYLLLMLTLYFLLTFSQTC